MSSRPYNWYSEDGVLPPTTKVQETRQNDPEPLWYLRGLSYGVYRQTTHWVRRRRAFIDSLSAPGRLWCERCGLDQIGWVRVHKVWYLDLDGKPCTAKSKLYPRKYEAIEWEPRLARFDVHHLTYERLGEELDGDLELLCHACHNLEHRENTVAARFWNAHRFREGDDPYDGSDPGSPSSVGGVDVYDAYAVNIGDVEERVVGTEEEEE